MAQVIRLSDELSNQIAAGEVVERPASVVKELVENAMDAGSTKIQIDVSAGGMSIIRVTDDGAGMDERDAHLAVERHATSKIGHFRDLLTLRTFGFRGEALPSIASVSRFCLQTRPAGCDAGVEVAIEGGVRVRQGPCGMAPGTIVEVRELFYNVPARRKFLKSAAAEAGAIGNAIDGLALSAHDRTFVLTRDSRKARQWLRAASREHRVLDARPDQKLQRVDGARGPMRLEAYLSPPEMARAGAVALTILVNGRVIRDRALTRVIAHAYGSVLEQGRYPVGVVYIDIEPQLVDVNVHPQKAEVRFADGRAVQDAVHSIVKEGVSKAFGITAPTDVRRWERDPVTEPRPAELGLRDSRPSDADAHDPWGLMPQAPVPPASLQQLLDLTPAKPAWLDAPREEQGGGLRYSALRFLAQARCMFLICEGPQGLAILDQHAAAERVTFARLRAAYLARAVASQRLLMATTISVDAEEAAFIEDNAEAIAATGLELRISGPTTAVVSAVPQIVSRAAPERLARDLLDEASRAGGRSFSAAVDRVLATMACHGSLRSGDLVSGQEAAALLDGLDEVDHSGHCPHGRPLVMMIRFDELERQVGRR